MNRLKVALIGAGQIARVSHIPGYLKTGRVELAGICDTRLEAAQQLAREFGIPAAFNNHQAMLECVKPDAVSVCVPNKFHCAVTLDALRAGCHVLCEKPPAITAEEAAHMARAAEAAGRLLSYGFHLRYGKGVQLLKQKIDAGEFGDIYAAEAKWLRRRGVPGWGCFTNKAIQGGGPLIDIGAHVLDLAVYLMDYPQIDYVCAEMYNAIGKTGCNGFMGSWDPEKFTVEDALFAQIRFKNGAVLRLDTSFALNMKEKDERSVKLFGDRQGASLFPLEIYAGGDGEAYNQTYPFENGGDLHDAEIASFVRACLGEGELLVTAQQGAYLQHLIELLYTSAETHRPVFAQEAASPEA